MALTFSLDDYHKVSLSSSMAYSPFDHRPHSGPPRAPWLHMCVCTYFGNLKSSMDHGYFMHDIHIYDHPSSTLAQEATTLLEQPRRFHSNPNMQQIIWYDYKGMLVGL
jgi:hypothetical protein